MEAPDSQARNDSTLVTAVLTDLSDVNGWVDAMTHIHHYGGTQILEHKYNFYYKTLETSCSYL